jgi:hypothetical protein
MKLAYTWSLSWSVRDRQVLVERFGESEVADAQDIWKQFAESVTPDFEDIQKDSLLLSLKQPFAEQIDFHQGLAKGLRFLAELRKRMQPVHTKRHKDAQARINVYAFALLNWELIEEHRRSLTWMDLTDAFDEFFEHQISIDEETFKKILQRCGLRGIGSVGRPKASE